MANLSNYDPFNMRLNRFLNHFFSDRPVFLDEQTQALNLKIDVSEDDNAYQVHADLPGVKKEDIRVNVDRNQVIISAEVKNSKEEKKSKNMLCCERYEGKVYRSFSLDKNIDEDKAEAKFNDGVLELILPKCSDQASNKQISIQ